MNAKGRSLLKIMGILYLIFAVLSLLFLIGLLVAREFLVKEEQMTMFLILVSIDTAIKFITGFVGIKYSNDPEHANINLIFGGLSFLMVILFMFKNQINVYTVLGLVFPLLYLTGAYLNKKMDINAFREENDL